MHEDQQEFSFKSLFIPFTTSKAIHFIIIIGIIVYGNMLFNEFVWDDNGYIIQNVAIHSIDIRGIFGPSLFNTASQYRPFPALYFSVLYSLLSTNQFFYHLLQLLLHLANTVLVFLLFKHFINKKLSFFLSLIFLIHPLQVESVSYIASSDNPLFFLFGMSALLMSIKSQINIKKISSISILIFLSLLSKETGLLFIFIILLVALLYRKKYFNVFLISLIATSFVYFSLRVIEIGNHYSQLSLSPIAGVPLFERLISMPSIIFYYLSNFIYPSKLAVDQLWIIKTPDFGTFYYPLLIESLLIVLVILIGSYIFKKNKKMFSAYLFFFVWLVLGFGMYCQIVPIDFTVADRWFYFPVVGILGIIGISIQSFKFSAHGIHKYAWVLGMIIIVLLAIRTMARNSDWKDALSLFTHDSSIVENYDIENNVGSEYHNRHAYKDAIYHYQRSVELYPYELNLYNLAVVNEEIGNLPMAKKYFLKTLNLNKYIIDRKFRLGAYVGLSEIYTYFNNPTVSSIEFLKNGLREYPNSGDLWAALAYSYFKTHNREDMLTAADQAKKYLSEDKKVILDNLIFRNVPFHHNFASN